MLPTPVPTALPTALPTNPILTFSVTNNTHKVEAAVAAVEAKKPKIPIKARGGCPRSIQRMGVNEGDRVLEIGVGNGMRAEAIALLAGEDGSVVTLDPSNETTEEAKADLTALLDAKRVYLVSGPIDWAKGLTKFEDGSFDKVLCVNAIYLQLWHSGVEAALVECHRVMEEGSLITVVVPGATAVAAPGGQDGESDGESKAGRTHLSDIMVRFSWGAKGPVFVRGLCVWLGYDCGRGGGNASGGGGGGRV